MKLRFVDRALIALGGLVLMALGVFVVLAAGGAIQMPEPFQLDTWLGAGWQVMPLIFVIGLLLVAWGAYLVILPLRAQQDSAGKYYAVRDGGEDGVHISVTALEHLAQKAIAQWPEILSSQIRISGQENAMRIMLRVTLQSDTKIPDLTRQVRAAVKGYMEQYAGVTVESVKVVIDATRDGGKKAFVRRDTAVSEAELPPAIPEIAVIHAQRQPQPAPQPAVIPEAAAAQGPEAVREPVIPEPIIMPEPVAAEPAENPFPFALSEEVFPFPGVAADEAFDMEEAAEAAIDPEEDEPDA